MIKRIHKDSRHPSRALAAREALLVDEVLALYREGSDFGVLGGKLTELRAIRSAMRHSKTRAH